MRAADPASRSRLLRIRATGLVGTLLMAVTGGRLATPVNQAPPSSWLGLLGAFDSAPARAGAGIALVVGLLLCSWSFLALLRLVAAGGVGIRGVVGTGCLWALPVLVGPPLMSLDVYSYAAQGEMVGRGLDPYRLGPEFIRGPFVEATDPRWRAAHAPYGPLALLLSRAAVLLGAHTVVGTILVLRGFAVLAVAATAVLVLRIPPASESEHARALVVAIASPLVLVTLLSGVHHEALLGALIVGAVVAQQRGRPGLAVALAAAAVADKLPGAVALGTLGALHLADAAGLRQRCRVVVRDTGAVLAVWVPLALVVPDPLGWVRALSTPGLGHTPYAPVSLVALVSRIPEGLVRAAGEVVSVLVVGRLLLTVRRRSLEQTVGWGLLTVALLGPVLYPWYLAPAAVVLATVPTRPARLVSAMSGAWGLLLSLPRVDDGWRLVVGASRAPGAGLGGAAAAALVAGRVRAIPRRGRRLPSPGEPAAGGTAGPSARRRHRAAQAPPAGGVPRS